MRIYEGGGKLEKGEYRSLSSEGRVKEEYLM